MTSRANPMLVATTPVGKSRPQRRCSRLWGDGFAEDSWQDLDAVRSWDVVERDEFVRLFPRLVPSDGRLPERLLAHVSDVVAVRAWRLRHIHGIPEQPLASMAREVAELTGGRRHAAIFAAPDLLERVMARCRGARVRRAAAEEERADLVVLDEVLWKAQRGALAPAGPAQTAIFGFLAGLHPAYLWPSAVATHERDAAAAWLGIVARGRPALMTLEVADYFADAITEAGGACAMRDRQMGQLARRSAPLATLRAAAAERRRGRPVVVRRRSLAPGADPAAPRVATGWAVPDLFPIDQS